MKRALRAILIAGEKMKKQVLSGEKCVTIREGHRDYTCGPVLIGCHLKNWATMKFILNVEHTTLGKVDILDIMSDGYNDRQEALADLKKYYPNITLESEVTVIRWGEPEY